MVRHESLRRMMSHGSTVLSDRSGPRPGPAETMRTVEQAAARLRGGRLVLVNEGAQAILVQAAETASVESLARLARLGDGCLVLTAQRGGALQLPVNGHRLLCLPLSEGIDLDAVRRMIDPTHPEGPLSRSAMPCAPTAGTFAAITLTKLAELLPAALTVPLGAGGRSEAMAIESNLLQVDATAVAPYG